MISRRLIPGVTFVKIGLSAHKVAFRRIFQCQKFVAYKGTRKLKVFERYVIIFWLTHMLKWATIATKNKSSLFLDQLISASLENAYDGTK